MGSTGGIPGFSVGNGGKTGEWVPPFHVGGKGFRVPGPIFLMVSGPTWPFLDMEESPDFLWDNKAHCFGDSEKTENPKMDLLGNGWEMVERRMNPAKLCGYSMVASPLGWIGGINGAPGFDDGGDAARAALPSPSASVGTSPTILVRRRLALAWLASRLSLP